MNLLGKTFVVTGAASGLGLAATRRLLQLQATVHAIDKAADINIGGIKTGKAHLYPSVDITSREKIRKTFEAIVSTSPQVSGLAHCAAILGWTPSTAEHDDVCNRLWDVNVRGTWIVGTEFHAALQAAAKEADPKQHSITASIVNVGSMASVKGFVGLSSYCATKHAVLGLTRTWAQEWGPQGLRVNLVAPGVVNTPMFDVSTLDENGPHRPALKPYAEPEEVANVIEFLLTDASSHITGQMLEVNGGLAVVFTYLRKR